jgi:hypothetical protein
MPHADELPASLAGLVRRQALELSPARFDFDTSRLLKVLDKTLAEVRTTQAGAVAPDTSGGPDGSVPDSVTLTVENPPRLAVGPATVDFGTVHDPPRSESSGSAIPAAAGSRRGQALRTRGCTSSSTTTRCSPLSTPAQVAN